MHPTKITLGSCSLHNKEMIHSVHKASGCHVEHGQQQVSVLPESDLAEMQHISISPSIVPEWCPERFGEKAVHAKGPSVAFYAGH